MVPWLILRISSPQDSTIKDRPSSTLLALLFPSSILTFPILPFSRYPVFHLPVSHTPFSIFHFPSSILPLPTPFPIFHLPSPTSFATLASPTSLPTFSTFILQSLSLLPFYYFFFPFRLVEQPCGLSETARLFHHSKLPLSYSSTACLPCTQLLHCTQVYYLSLL